MSVKKEIEYFLRKLQYSTMMRGLLSFYPSGTMNAAIPKQGFEVRRIGD
jgi:hypothetical protein